MNNINDVGKSFKNNITGVTCASAPDSTIYLCFDVESIYIYWIEI